MAFSTCSTQMMTMTCCVPMDKGDGARGCSRNTLTFTEIVDGDLDSDGIPNFIDPDNDNDGTPDSADT